MTVPPPGPREHSPLQTGVCWATGARADGSADGRHWDMRRSQRWQRALRRPVLTWGAGSNSPTRGLKACGGLPLARPEYDHEVV